MSLQINNSFIS